MKRYNPLLVTLHWLLAAMIIGGLITGNFVLSQTPNSDPAKLFGLRVHMSMGIAILALMLLRLAVRLFTAKPPRADTGVAALNLAGVAAHWGLYALVIALAASGLAIANIAGLPGIVFGGEGTLPADFSDIAPRAAHGILATLLGLLVIAHVAGWAYHALFVKDHLLSRMWFGNRTGG